MRTLIRLTAFAAAAALLADCASNPAPVVDRSLGGEAASQKSNVETRALPGTAEHANGMMTPQGYVVARGDTLYSIAFKHGMDYRALAQRNGIAPPYTIQPGQVLKLDNGVAIERNASNSSVAAPPAVVRAPPNKNAPVFGPVENNPPAGQQVETTRLGAASASSVTTLPQVNLARGSTPTNAQQTNSASQKAMRPGAIPPHATEVAALPASAESAGSTTSTSNIASAQPLSRAASGRMRTVDGVTWQWPSDGAVISNSGSGLDIAGNPGDPVRAAADGTVVYSGNGLIGYGELIIIKHSDNYLSAYGHNRKRLVQEGQRVRAGQVIAEMGSTGAPREELHFEIRKAGKPVDPTDYLPAR
ncbi:MAG: peptidase M23 [Rhodanobacteraceae bacterium]